MAYFSVLFITTKNIKKDFPQDSFGQTIVDILQHIEHPFYKEHAIHAEIIINNTAYSAVGLPPDQCVRCYTPNPRLATYDCVEIYHIPLTDPDKAQSFLDKAVNTPATHMVGGRQARNQPDTPQPLEGSVPGVRRVLRPE